MLLVTTSRGRKKAEKKTEGGDENSTYRVAVSRDDFEGRPFTGMPTQSQRTTSEVKGANQTRCALSPPHLDRRPSLYRSSAAHHWEGGLPAVCCVEKPRQAPAEPNRREVFHSGLLCSQTVNNSVSLLHLLHSCSALPDVLDFFKMRARKRVQARDKDGTRGDGTLYDERVVSPLPGLPFKRPHHL